MKKLVILTCLAALCGCATPDVRVPAVHCTAQDGYVWLCIGTPATPEPLPFACLDEAGYTTFRMKTRFAAPVDWCLENFERSVFEGSGKVNKFKAIA